MILQLAGELALESSGLQGLCPCQQHCHHQGDEKFLEHVLVSFCYGGRNPKDSFLFYAAS